MAGIKRRSSRQAATRKRSMYVYSDSDSDSDSEAEFQPEEVPAPPPKRRKTTRTTNLTKRKPQTRSKTRSKKEPSVRSTFKVGKPRKLNGKAAREKEQNIGFSGPSDNKTPLWTSLPVDILRDIFIFASLPTHETPQASDNGSWLLKTARTCRAFALPALEAYYQSPALLDKIHPHNFLELLGCEKEKLYIDYSVKVKSLLMDVRTLAYVAHNRAAFNVAALVEQLPCLQHMEIRHPMYEPPFRPVKDIQRWTFPGMELFHAMERSDIRLKSWRWSRDMISMNPQFDLYAMMSQAHDTRALSRVQRLVVCGFNYQDSSEPTLETNEDADDPLSASRHGQIDTTVPGLATSIAKLSSLKDLSFTSCDVVMEKFLQRLPNNLQRLELSNCLEITSGMIELFISTSGSQLRELVLNHNAALSLSFLQGLKRSCPRLEVLKLNMTYYSEKVVVNDAEPLYDELLSADETPQWPSSLRELEILHASKWSPEAAQTLFRSLVDSAPDLPNLRRLVLHAHINIPWRDRIGFREQWIERLRRVYLRQNSDPCKHLGSLRQFRLWKQVQQYKSSAASDGEELGEGHSRTGTPMLLRIAQVEISPYKPSGDTEACSDSDSDDAPIRRPVRRSKRVAESHISPPSSPSTESDSDENDVDDWRRRSEKFIQGLCDVVDVRIDNQRPREEQWTEQHFLDSEVSGDEDWNEDADSGDEETYAW